MSEQLEGHKVSERLAVSREPRNSRAEHARTRGHADTDEPPRRAPRRVSQVLYLAIAPRDIDVIVSQLSRLCDTRDRSCVAAFRIRQDAQDNTGRARAFRPANAPVHLESRKKVPGNTRRSLIIVPCRIIVAFGYFGSGI